MQQCLQKLFIPKKMVFIPENIYQTYKYKFFQQKNFLM